MQHHYNNASNYNAFIRINQRTRALGLTKSITTDNDNDITIRKPKPKNCITFKDLKKENLVRGEISLIDMNDGNWFAVEVNILNRVLETVSDWLIKHKSDWVFKHKVHTYPSGRTVAIIYRQS